MAATFGENPLQPHLGQALQRQGERPSSLWIVCRGEVRAPISPLYLPYISPISPLYLAHLLALLGAREESGEGGPRLR